MFRAGVSQKLVQQRTGHKSLEALHQYERPSEKQLLDVSNIMSNNDKGDSSAAVVSVSNQVVKNNLIKNSQAVKKGVAPKKVMVKKLGTKFT